MQKHFAKSVMNRCNAFVFSFELKAVFHLTPYIQKVTN